MLFGVKNPCSFYFPMIGIQATRILHQVSCPLWTTVRRTRYNPNGCSKKVQPSLTHNILNYQSKKWFHISSFHLAKDLYKIIGVSKAATKAEIKKAYQELAKKHHPDKNIGKENDDLFQEITQAYMILSDPKQRKKYDDTGNTLSSPELMDMDRMSSEISKQGMSCMFVLDQTLDVSKGDNVEHDLPLSVLQAVHGIDIKFQSYVDRHCKSCDGTGSKSKKKAVRCEDCRGTGYDPIFSATKTMKVACKSCGGHGSFIEDECTPCKGTGVKTHLCTNEISIPAGVCSDSYVRVLGQGHYGKRGGTAGDIYLKVDIQPEEGLWVEKSDIHVEVPISYTKAMLGGTVKLKLYNDSEQLIDIKPGSQHGETVHLRGLGLLRPNSSLKGDIVVHLKIKSSEYSQEQLELVKELAKSEESAAVDFQFSMEKVLSQR